MATKNELIMSIMEIETKGGMTPHTAEELEVLSNQDLNKLLKEVTATAEKVLAERKESVEESRYNTADELCKKNTFKISVKNITKSACYPTISGKVFEIKPGESIVVDSIYQRFFKTELFQITNLGKK